MVVAITFQEGLDLAADGVRHPVVRDALDVLELVVVRDQGVAPIGDQIHNLVPPCGQQQQQQSHRFVRRRDKWWWGRRRPFFFFPRQIRRSKRRRTGKVFSSLASSVYCKFHFVADGKIGETKIDPKEGGK